MNLIEQLKQIPDPRQLKGRQHSLWMLLLLSLLGVLCNYRGYRPLADFCLNHGSTLEILLELPRYSAVGGNTNAQNVICQVSIHNHQMGVLQLRLMGNKKVSELHVAQRMLRELPALPPGQCFSVDALHTHLLALKGISLSATQPLNN